MTRVIIESPYAENNGLTVDDHIFYAQKCLLDSLMRQETPFASHILYTQVLNDLDKNQRELGMRLALKWYEVADLCAVYQDLGISKGMRYGMDCAKEIGLTIEYRSIGNVCEKNVGRGLRSGDW